MMKLFPNQIDSIVATRIQKIGNNLEIIKTYVNISSVLSQ